MKKQLVSEAEVLQPKTKFEGTFVQSALKAWIIYIAYNLQAPPNLQYGLVSVYFHTAMATEIQVIVPETVHSQTFRNLGATLFTGLWFAFSSGFQTKNGVISRKERFIDEEKIRKVKCYFSRREFSAVREKTVYETLVGWSLMRGVKDAFNLRSVVENENRGQGRRRNRSPNWETELNIL